MPKLRKQPFETAIIERYRRRECSVEEAMIEMYLAGVSVRRVEDITEALWGTKVSPATVSKLNGKIYKHIEAWRNRPIEGHHAVCLSRWGRAQTHLGRRGPQCLGPDCHRRRHRRLPHVLGIAEGLKEDKAGWSGFLKHLKQRGLAGTRLFISDACLGLVESLGELYPDADWQRCTVHFYRNVFSHVPKAKVREVTMMLKAIHAQEDLAAARDKSRNVTDKLHAMKLGQAAKVVEDGIEDTLTYYRYPDSHWRRIRTNNPMERLIKEIRRRTKVVGAFPDGHSAVMLAAARLRHVATTKWGTRRYLDMRKLEKWIYKLQPRNRSGLRPR